MEFKVKGKELLKKIEDLIKEGNVRRIIIKDTEGKPFIEIPLSFGVIGVLAAPIVAAVGALAGVVANFSGSSTPQPLKPATSSAVVVRDNSSFFLIIKHSP